jgi:hypothetical protein
MQGDDLSILLFWITLAVTFGYEAVKAETKLRRISLGLLAGIFLLCGVFWLQIKKIWPPLTESMGSVANSPQTWFTLFIFIAAIVIFGRPARVVATGKATAGNETRPGGAITEDSDSSESTDQLALQLAQLRGRLDAMAKDTSIPGEIKEVKDHLEKIEKNTVRNNGRIHEYEQYHLNTLNGLIEQLAHSLLFDSTPELPAICSLRELTPENFGAEAQKASDYWKQARSTLSDTSWSADLRYIEQDAKNTGDRAIRDIPIGERPAGIDPLDLARFAEMKYRAESCSRYLDNAKVESHIAYRSILSRLRELYQQITTNMKSR